jgi:hypothetical protein
MVLLLWFDKRVFGVTGLVIQVPSSSLSPPFLEKVAVTHQPRLRVFNCQLCAVPNLCERLTKRGTRRASASAKAEPVAPTFFAS